MTLPPDLIHGFCRAEFQTMRRTHGNTGRFQSVVDAVHTIIAFDDFADFRIPLWRSPWAGGNAGLASHAQGMIHENNTVLRPFLHGAGGTGGNAPGIFTVKAGHEYIGCPGKSPDEFGADGHDLAELGADRQRLVAFTLDFTAVAADAFFFVLKQEIFAHYYSYPSHFQSGLARKNIV